MATTTKHKYLSSQDTTKEKKKLLKVHDQYMLGNNIVSGTFSLSESLGNDGNFQLGTAVTQSLKLTFVRLPDSLQQLKGKIIEPSTLFEVKATDLREYKIDNAISILMCDTFYLLQFPESNIVKRYNKETKAFEKQYTCQYRVDSMFCFEDTLYFGHKNQERISKVNGDIVELVPLLNYQKEFIDTNNQNIYTKDIDVGNSVVKKAIYRETYLFNEKLFEKQFLGKFTCDKATKDNSGRVEILALGEMDKFNIDVSDWWNNLTFPKTLQEILNELCSKTNILSDYISAKPTHFTVQHKPNTVSSLKGTTVLKWIGEVLGCYITLQYIDVDGKTTALQFSQLGNRTENVSSPNGTHFDYIELYKRNSLTFAEYKTKKIDKLQIRQSQDDVGVIVGTGTNTYILEDNPLLYTQTNDEILSIATKLFDIIKDIQFVPFEVVTPFNPAISVGNKVKVKKSNGELFETIVFSVDFTGAGSLMTTVKATGDESREQVNMQNNYSPKKLYGRMNELVVNVEKTFSKLTDNYNGLQSQVEQTAEAINLQVQREKYHNLLTNSDFTEWQGGKPLGWKDYSTNTLSLSMVDDADFPTGKALRIKGTDGSPENLFQTIPIALTTRYFYLSADFKWISSNVIGGKLYFHIFYKPKGQPHKHKESLPTTFTANKYERIGVLFDLGSEIEIEKIDPRIYVSSIGQEILINRVFFTSDYPPPDKHIWNKHSNLNVISQINLVPDGIKISGSKINIHGLTTFTNPDGSGSTTIEGGTFSTGHIVNLKTINGTPVNATGDITAVNWNGDLVKLRYNNGIVTSWQTFMSNPAHGAGVNGQFPIGNVTMTFRGGILRKIILGDGTIIGTD